MPLKSGQLLLAVIITFGSAAADAAHPAVDRALHLIGRNAAIARTTTNDEYLARNVVVDADGTEHVRFDRSYRGLPVIGGDLVVHSRNGQYRSMSLSQRTPLQLSTSPAIKSVDAIVIAGMEFGTTFESMPKSRLVVHARGEMPRLARTWSCRISRTT